MECIFTGPKLFQSTHSLRSATHAVSLVVPGKSVSIHALLAECDMETNAAMAHGYRFQSTHSLRSATRRHGCALAFLPRFNPRTPCGVRQGAGPPKAGKFSFQSTHSLRSATQQKDIALIAEQVSIHALLAECDAGCPYCVHYVTVSIHALLAECDTP